LTEFCRQTVPVSLGNVMVLLDVAVLDSSVVVKALVALLMTIDPEVVEAVPRVRLEPATVALPDAVNSPVPVVTGLLLTLPSRIVPPLAACNDTAPDPLPPLMVVVDVPPVLPIVITALPVPAGVPAPRLIVWMAPVAVLPLPMLMVLVAVD